MLVIRYQRTGRSGHAHYRLVVQDARRSPTSGSVVAQLGSYNPHTKVATLNNERIEHFLNNGAQPSDRAALLLKKEGIKLPKWVNLPQKRSSAIKNTDKLRKNRPTELDAPKENAAQAPTQVVTADIKIEDPIATDVSENSTEESSTGDQAVVATEAPEQEAIATEPESSKK